MSFLKEEGPVLVTGAYGLIGHSVTQILRAGGASVVPTDILDSRPGDAELDALMLDIRGTGQIARFMSDHGIRKIVHTAGVSGPAVAQGAPHRTFSTNVGGTLDLFEAARICGIERVVLISSASVYGSVDDTFVSEQSPLEARDVYGASKIGGELVARSYASEFGLEAVILRPSWVYGLRRRTPCVIRDILRDAIAMRSTTLEYGHGWTRQFVWVEDVASAVRDALTAEGVSGKAFNISDGVCTRFEDLAAMVGAMFEDARISILSAPPPDDALTGCLTLDAAADQLGWSPQTDLRSGLKQYADGLLRSGRE